MSIACSINVVTGISCRAAVSLRALMVSGCKRMDTIFLITGFLGRPVFMVMLYIVNTLFAIGGKMKRIITLVIFSSFVGCSSGYSIVQLKPAIVRPVNCEVEFFGTEKELPQNYETVCIIESHTGQGFTNTSASAAINASMPALCACGADAGVVVTARAATAMPLLSIFAPVKDMYGYAEVKGVKWVTKK